MTGEPQTAVDGTQALTPQPAVPTPPAAAPTPESPEPTPESPGPKPRGRRAPSAAQLAASRLNIAKARRRWLDLRKAPGFQPSPRYLQATHSNLRQAVHRNLHNDSSTYAPCFRDGLSAVSLQRSVRQAGERLEDYTAHVEWFVQTFTRGQDLGSELAPGAPPAGILKLSLALGFVSWRRRRGFRLLGEWERLTVCQKLADLARTRARGAVWGAASIPLSPEETAQRERDLALIWLTTLTSDYLALPANLLNPKLCTLENRLELLARALLAERDEPDFYERAHWGRIMEEYERWPAEALGNPLVSAPAVVEALKSKRATLVTLAPPSGWRPFGSGVKPEDELDRQVRKELAPERHQRIAHARRQEAQGQSASPRSFEEFLPLVEAAMGIEVGIGLGVEARPEAGATARDHGSTASDPELREFAEALWARLEVYRLQAEQEREDLRALQQAYADSLASGTPLSVTQLAERLVRLFHHSRRRAFNRAHAANQRLDWAIYSLLLKRYGEHQDFKIFKPAPPDNVNLLIDAMLLNQRGCRAEAEELYAEYQRQKAQYKQMEARARGQPAAGCGQEGKRQEGVDSRR